MTYRQLLAWMCWLEQQWNEPDRHDYYLMQIAYEVKRGNAKRPSSVHWDKCKIPFKQVGQKQRVTPKQASDRAKARWVGMMGVPVKVVDADTSGTRELDGASDRGRVGVLKHASI